MFNAKRKKLLERFLILSLFCSSGAVWAQQGTVTLNLNNVTVKEALEQLNTQTSYSLWLNVGDVDLSRRISLNVTNGSVNDVLAKILAGQPLSYEVKDRTINIYPAKKDGEEAKKRVEGVVLDDLGEPLPGVAVRCKEHPDAMCATDMDGKFTLNVPTDGKTLQFTFIGMAPQELAVADAPMKVVMSDKEKKLDEVVVTGYQKIDRKLFTGAASRISGEEAKVDGVGDVSQMLQGRRPVWAYSPCPVRSVLRRRSVCVVLLPSMETRRRFGLWTVSCWRMWWRFPPMTFLPVMPPR